MKKILTILLMGFCIPVVHAQDATEIVKKADEKMRGESNYSEMTMKIVRPDWQREIKMKAWSKGQDYSLIRITAPARDEGSAFLKRDQEIWNWQPSINRVIKLPPSMMMQSWMGSDFTNDDLVKESSIVTDYTHKYVGDTTILGRPTYKLELIPQEDAPVVWGKVLLYITKEDYLELLVKYYDEDDFLINTMVLSDIKDMDGRKIPARMEMIPADQPDHKTIITYQKLDFNVDLSQNFFSLQNMKSIR